MQKEYSRDIEHAAIVTRTARITGLGKRYVKMVIAGKRHNQLVMDTFMFLQEGEERLVNVAKESVRSFRKHAAI